MNVSIVLKLPMAADSQKIGEKAPLTISARDVIMSMNEDIYDDTYVPTPSVTVNIPPSNSAASRWVNTTGSLPESAMRKLLRRAT